MRVKNGDQELLKMILHETPLGIEIAIDMYGGAVKKICREILAGCSDEDIEETVADCFTALWQSVHNYDITRGSCLKSYIYGIARRTAYNKKRQLRKSLQCCEAPCQYLAADDDVEAEIEKRIETEILRQLVLELKSPDREIFIKRYFLSMTVKDIAGDLEISCKTVENKLSRGKKKLKKQLIKRGVDCE